MKLVVAGSREGVSRAYVWGWLDCYQMYGKRKISHIVCGMARGVDLFGLEWAKDKGIPVIKMPADWDRLGKRAGIVRNGEMAKVADCAVVFFRPGGSRGARNMASQMDGLGKPVIRIRRK